ncbi:ArsR family transcriptional regulator [Gemella sp. zg-570]|uniref:ArsR/SmtB family transcription factor n=1 Tax=Gemella sp. zg-570 TaxID=2840371 RepID=UPI001C0ADC64|nr:winged helix-turn-helix domain-containing protein [Gemella sp. zg-570]QWQ38889.1 ArsR family transcriptional regulator [Gemella sp. zg-570]
MKFSSKEKRQLLDFIIGLECLNPEYMFSLEEKQNKIDTIEFYTLYKALYNEISSHILDFNNVFCSPFYPMLQMTYRSLYKKQNIENVAEFLATIKTLTDEEIKFTLKMLIGSTACNDAETVKAIKNLQESGQVKYYLLQIYENPSQFIANTLKVFETIYPIYLNYFTKAEDLFSKKLEKVLAMDKAEIYKASINFLGSEKLSALQREYKDIKRISLEEAERCGNEIEVAPLMFGANRINIITKPNEGDTTFNNTHNKPIYCIGLDSIFYAKKMKKAEVISKKVLKALSDDTRLDILRMISFGLNTNKKLSKFFQVSPPAITYQTNILKEAGIIDTREYSSLYVKRDQLEYSLNQIQELLSLKGNSEH